MKDPVTRGNCFKLLGACFYEPEKQLFMEEQVCENLVHILEQSSLGAAKAANEMSLALVNYSQEQLSIDHAALFVGPFELIAAPYGSVFKEKNRQLMGKTTVDVMKFYADAGLAVDEKEPPDHISIELEFMYFLCMNEAEAVSSNSPLEASKYRTLQVQFFRSALGWIPDFCNTIKNGTKNLFYLALADCLARFMIDAAKYYERQPMSPV